MKAPTAREIRAAAASVLGTRSAGITTPASEAAPALLERAEAVLAALEKRAADLEPSAPDQTWEARYYAAAAQATAYMEAIDELRAALGMETHAARLAAGLHLLAYAIRNDKDFQNFTGQDRTRARALAAAAGAYNLVQLRLRF